MNNEFKEKLNEVDKIIEKAKQALKNKLSFSGIDLDANETLKNLISLIPVDYPIPIDAPFQSAGNRATDFEDMIFIMFGDDDSYHRGYLQVYDIKNKKFTQRAGALAGRSYHIQLKYKDSFFLGGGFEIRGAGSLRQEFYNIFGDFYIGLKNLERSKYRGSGELIEEGIIYIGGGTENRKSELSNLKNGTSTLLHDLPYSFSRHTSNKNNKYILITSGESTKRQFFYDYKTGVITEKESLPEIISNHSSVMLNDEKDDFFKVIISGGDSVGTQRIYNSKNGTLTTKKVLPMPVKGQSAVKIRGNILFTGGEYKSGDYPMTEKQFLYKIIRDNFAT